MSNSVGWGEEVFGEAISGSLDNGSVLASDGGGVGCFDE